MKAERFPHTWEAPSLVEMGGGLGRGSFGATEESTATGAEGKAERYPQRGSLPTSTHQPERLVYSPARAGRGWELRLRLWRADPREETGVGCMKTA